MNVETSEQTNVLTPTRDYKQERLTAISKSVDRVVAIRDAREDGTIGEEVIKLAQALILCTLPYRPTAERQTSRSARLSDGSTLEVTFTAAIKGIDLPYGADRHLMAWLFDRAIVSDTSFVTFKNASDYLLEAGRTVTGSAVRNLAARIQRISGLAIGINRRTKGVAYMEVRSLVKQSKLPANLTLEVESANFGQQSLPGLENRYGIQFDDQFFQEIKSHHLSMSRMLWRKLQESKVGPQMQDLLLFFLYRCYSAASETLIPWSGLRAQFPQGDSNPRRFKSNVKLAVQEMKLIWPEVRLEAMEDGLLVGPATQQFLPDDTSKNRVRRIAPKASRSLYAEER